MIESEHKTSLLISLFVIVLVLGSVLLLYTSSRPDTYKLHIAGTQFIADVASTPLTRERGLSGRENLPDDHAMLFNFDTKDNQCFWMKDMKFNIDIVWLDEQNQVSAIESNVSPSSYPKSFCHDGLHVIELSAGTTERIKLKIGDQVDL